MFRITFTCGILSSEPCVVTMNCVSNLGKYLNHLGIRNRYDSKNNTYHIVDLNGNDTGEIVRVLKEEFI